MLSRAAPLFAMVGYCLSPAWAQVDCAALTPGPCSLLREGDAIFVGTVIEHHPYSTTKFRVTEPFKGVRAGVLDIDYGMFGTHFELGKKYLIFAVRCPWTADRRCLTPWACSNTRPLDEALALVEQLRAEKSGQPMAAIYGMLTREPPPGLSIVGYSRPLPNIVVRLKSGKHSWETRTDEYGAFAFYRRPRDAYQLTAVLPPNLMQAPDWSPPPELQGGKCFEHNLAALAKGQISGKVIGPDGKPLSSTSVDLYYAGNYEKGKDGSFAFQKSTPTGEVPPFTYPNLPAGEYLLVYNSANTVGAHTPFPRTFYPQASDLKSAQLIHLSDGQQVANADIHLSDPWPTRQVVVHFDWNGRTPRDYRLAQVIAKPTSGPTPFPTANRDDTYTLFLLPSARYSIHAEASCKRAAVTAKTAEVTVDGADPSISEITLKFDAGTCAPR